jgi:hypothetical protein
MSAPLFVINKLSTGRALTISIAIECFSPHATNRGVLLHAFCSGQRAKGLFISDTTPQRYSLSPNAVRQKRIDLERIFSIMQGELSFISAKGQRNKGTKKGNPSYVFVPLYLCTFVLISLHRLPRIIERMPLNRFYALAGRFAASAGR